MSEISTILAENLKYGEQGTSLSVNLENIAVDILLFRSFYANPNLGESKSEEVLYTAHDHAVFELFIIENGQIRINAGEDIEVKSGEMLLIRPRIIHHVVSASDNAKYFCIRFDIHAGERLSGGDIPQYRKISLNVESFSFLSALISELRRTVSLSETPLEIYRVKAKLGIIISYALEGLADVHGTPPSDSHNHVELYAKIENYLYLNYEKKLTLESLAFHLSYSRTHMRRIMDACYGMPFTQKLREIRLEAAKKYLAETDLSVDEIAEKCGYETRQGFESMFLKHVGVTPNKYRKSVTQ